MRAFFRTSGKAFAGCGRMYAMFIENVGLCLCLCLFVFMSKIEGYIEGGRSKEICTLNFHFAMYKYMFVFYILVRQIG